MSAIGIAGSLIFLILGPTGTYFPLITLLGAILSLVGLIGQPDAVAIIGFIMGICGAIALPVYGPSVRALILNLF